MSGEPITVPDGRFLVIGCGSIGKRHLSNLKQLGVTDLAAFDVREDRCREVEEQFGVPVFAELASALSQAVRVALVCTPPYLHLQHALMAARANCHLFIEKPIADVMEGLDQLLEEVKGRRLVTFVACNFRFHPGLRHVKVLLDKGAIGKVISARAQFGQYLPDWHPWEDYRQGYSARRSMGGGVVLDRIHEIDYLSWLLGEVTEVYAMVDHMSHLDIDTEDVAEILLRFNSGVIGSVHLDYLRRTYDCSLEVIGEEGIIQWHYQDNSVRWYQINESVWHGLEWPHYDGNEMYLAEMQYFMKVLQGQDASELDVNKGKRILAIALAAKQAVKDRRAIYIYE
jgi:predicted dehydrogenase